MSVVLAVLGVGVVLAALVDFALTTLSVAHVRGSLAALVTRTTYRLFGHGPRAVQAAGGPMAVLAVVASWFVLSGVGWALVIQGLGDVASPLDAFRAALTTMTSGAPVGLFDEQATVARFLGQVAHLYGIGLTSLSLAWILPVVSAVVQRREVAARVAALGARPQDLVVDDAPSTDLHLHLLDIAQDVVQLAERHRAYPVLHAFRTRESSTSLSVALLRLERAERKLRDTDVDPVTKRVLQHALDHFALVFTDTFYDVEDIDEDGLDGHVRDERRSRIFERLLAEEGWTEAQVDRDHDGDDPLARVQE